MERETSNKSKLERRVARGVGIAGLSICLIISYSAIIQEHGSLNNAYDSLMKQSENWPAKMFNVNY